MHNGRANRRKNAGWDKGIETKSNGKMIKYNFTQRNPIVASI